MIDCTWWWYLIFTAQVLLKEEYIYFLFHRKNNTSSKFQLSMVLQKAMLSLSLPVQVNHTKLTMKISILNRNRLIPISESFSSLYWPKKTIKKRPAQTFSLFIMFYIPNLACSCSPLKWLTHILLLRSSRNNLNGSF